jgi:hypothetical protein
MIITLRKRSPWLLAIVFLASALFATPQGWAQGRGHGQDKKAVKFINGHDARDGRWDGRGPRRRSVRGIWLGRQNDDRNRIRVRHGGKHRILYRTYRRY